MNNPEFPIVGIGASAGGLDAFHSFFEHMPPDCGMAFVTILHLPSERKSMLIEILTRWTTMRVLEGGDGTLVEPNCVYVPPPHAIVTFSDGHLGIQKARQDDRLFRPIDSFFDSLASALREKSVGIILSGTGSDGALGLKAIKECGGLTIAQGSDGTAPQYEQMPAGAIATGAVDLIVPVHEMPEHLLRVKGRNADSGQADGDASQMEELRLQICEILRARLGHDFSGYRSQTFLRRVERRMQVVNATTLQAYVARLQDDHDEVASLFRDLLIRVTSFFRDKDTFEALDAKVMPQLFAGKNADSAVRIWVPGCATGEEAYSLAILLREQMDKIKGAPKIQVFATDIDDSAISTARLGRYPATLLEGLSTERRERFFTFSQGSYVARKEIRDLCTFSSHNLVRDPPFSRMHLVSCRNLLIYMDAELQAKVIPIFHYALTPGGILLLGGSESVAKQRDLFVPLDKAARIFQRRDVQSPDLLLSSQPAPLNSSAVAHGPQVFTEADGHRTFSTNHRRAQARNPDPNNVPFDSLETLLGALPPSKESVEELQSALRSTSEQLLSLEEEHQTALEEVRSSNEELHSVNEEMQSTNEELETSKEELQSLNEELHTVNARLTEKIEELDEANSDLSNLFDSTEIATVFLDRNLIIRSFTHAVGALYNLIPSDHGRPLTDIVSRLDYEGLRDDVARVLKTLQPLERRIARKDKSTHYIMRILPYRDPDGAISGVLVTFVDVTSIVQAEAALREADLRKDLFLATLSHELRNPLAPIRTAARILESPDLEPVQLGRAQAIIARQVTHMSSLLDDLLDVSRITRGAFVLKRRRTDVKELIDGAVEEAQPLMVAKRHTLRVDIPEVPVAVEVDPVRLTQVLSNLLTNAAKYTPIGGLISVGSRLEAEDLILFVRDNGIGLAPAMLTRVFDMFAQVEKDGASEGGLGIGLALAQGLVQLHGGSISAQSAGLGHGCEFVVSLPRSLIVPASSMPGSGNGEAIVHIARRVLIADDNRDAAEMLEMFLTSLGHEVQLAHSGTEAIEVAQRWVPQVAVLDIGMPDLDGYEVAKRIRLEPWGHRINLIALTGWGQEDDIRRAVAAGFDHHCTKPVDPETLERFFHVVR